MKFDTYMNSTYETNGVKVHSGDTDSLKYLIAIPPGSGAIIEAIFPEEGYYFGNDHDLASLPLWIGIRSVSPGQKYIDEEK